MARKKKETLKEENLEIKENIITTPLEEIMGDRFGRYSKYIIQDRALPDARDGLKPVQRRILYSMNMLGIKWDKPYKKSARIVGDVIGKYHPHGDTSVYDAMIRMSQDWKARETLVDVHGNNGSMDDDAPAAMRYCVAGDTLVFTNKGLIRIDEIVPNSELNSDNDIDIFVRSFDGKMNHASKLFNSGVHRTYKVELKNGMEITGTSNHPILVYDEMAPGHRTWITIGSLKIGHVVYVYDHEKDQYLFSQIKRISYVKKQVVYSIRVDSECHSFIANGFVNHNTEARLSPISKYMLTDLDKDTVEFAPNFDDEEMEPTVMPAMYPNLLVNGTTGIAAGYATNIPPHNLSEILDATIYRIQHPKCNLDDLMEFVKGPDFPTGGIVQGISGIKDAFKTGKGRIIIRSKCEIVQEKTIQQIVVHEIPYEVVKCNLVKKIDELRIGKAIDGILDVRDESDRNGLRICIDLKKDAKAEAILNYLYKNTDLQVSYNYNVVAIVNKRPMQLGLEEMLDAFIEHRKDVVSRRCKFELDKAEKRSHILEGLIKAISILDEVIALIRKSKGKADAKDKLMRKYKFSESQAEAIVMLQLYRLSNTDVVELENELKQLCEKIKELNNVLNNNKALQKVIIKECCMVKEEFGSKRRTLIEEHTQDIVIDKKDMINSEQVMFVATEGGYVKRVSMRSYGSSNELPGFKEGDNILTIQEVNTLDTILFITDKGNYGYLPVFEINEHKWKDVGTHLNNLLNKANEKLQNVFVIHGFDTTDSLLTLSCSGMLKRTNIKDMEVSRSSSMMSLMKLDKDDDIVSSTIVKENEEIVVVSADGYAVRYNVDNVSPTGCRGKGIIAIKNKACVGLCSASMPFLLCITEKGATKRIKMEDINKTNRAVKGELIAKPVKSKPNVIRSVLSVDGNDMLNIIDDNTLKKIGIKQVPIMGKETTFSNAIGLSKEFVVMK